MILLYISIPLMILSLAIATLPILAAMRTESREQRAEVRALESRGARADQAPLAA